MNFRNEIGTYWYPTAILSILAILVKQYVPKYHFITKPLPMFLLIGHCVQKIDYSNFSLGICVGLIFGLFGDLFLLKDKQKSFFILGLVAFLIGHIAYIYSFILTQWIFPQDYLIVLLFFMIMYALLVAFKVYQTHPDFIIPVIAYIVVISTMLLTSINYEYARTNQIPYTVIGSFLFYISDSVLCWNKFILRKKLPEFLVLATYYPAQACILRGTVL